MKQIEKGVCVLNKNILLVSINSTYLIEDIDVGGDMRSLNEMLDLLDIKHKVANRNTNTMHRLQSNGTTREDDEETSEEET